MQGTVSGVEGGGADGRGAGGFNGSRLKGGGCLVVKVQVVV